MNLLYYFFRIISGASGSVLGINRRNLDYVYRKKSRSWFYLVDDKIATKDFLVSQGIPTPNTLMTFSWFGETLNLPQYLGQHEQFVIKPNHGRQGNGILVVAERTNRGYKLTNGSEISWDDIRKHVADIIMGVYSFGSSDTVLVEERIFPHSFFNNIYPRGLADIRVITWLGIPSMAMIRVPTDHSGGRANLHQGGVGIAVDLGSGTTTGAFYRKRPIAFHPDTGKPLIGLEIPRFNEILSMAMSCKGTLPLDYLGFDFVIDRDRGPMVIEINARPGLEIQNINTTGLRRILEKITEGYQR